jgi:hypothetical protein
MDEALPLIIFVVCAAGIAVAVWGLFLLGDHLGVPWYVSAVAILLIGRFAIFFLEHA